MGFSPLGLAHLLLPSCSRGRICLVTSAAVLHTCAAHSLVSSSLLAGGALGLQIWVTTFAFLTRLLGSDAGQARVASTSWPHPFSNKKLCGENDQMIPNKGCPDVIHVYKLLQEVLQLFAFLWICIEGFIAFCTCFWALGREQIKKDTGSLPSNLRVCCALKVKSPPIGSCVWSPVGGIVLEL